MPFVDLSNPTADNNKSQNNTTQNDQVMQQEIKEDNTTPVATPNMQDDTQNQTAPVVSTDTNNNQVNNNQALPPIQNLEQSGHDLLSKAPKSMGSTNEVNEIKGPPLPNLNQTPTPMPPVTNESDSDTDDILKNLESALGDQPNTAQQVEPQAPVVDQQAQATPSLPEQPAQSSSIAGGQGLPPLDSILGDNNQVQQSAPQPANSQNNEPVNQQAPAAPVAVEAQTQKKEAAFNPARVLSSFDVKSEVMDDFLSFTIANKASDLHLSANNPTFLRIDGELRPIQGHLPNNEMATKLIYQLLTEDQIKTLEEKRELDLSYQHSSGNRFRVNVFFKKDEISAALRLIESKIRSIEELGLPSILYEFTKVPHGLVIVTGPTGSGKSTTLASMINEINSTRAEHIITIEDPIEYVYPRSKSLIEQREIGRDTLSWTNALRSVLRQDPNIVLVGEMRDYETIEAAVTVAETGHLVFATLHTNSASQTIDRIIDVFPEGQQSQIRAQLANVLTSVVAQRLVPKQNGGRIAVQEIMIGNSAVRNAIRENKTYQIDNIIQTSTEIGMKTLESSLAEIVRAGEITLEQAQNYTVKPDELVALLNQKK